MIVIEVDVQRRQRQLVMIVEGFGQSFGQLARGVIVDVDHRCHAVALGVERLRLTIDGQPPTAESLLAHPESHPINWEVSPDRKTLWAVEMSTNGYIALVLGTIGTLALGGGLMTLLFYSQRHGYDDAAASSTPEDERH